MDDERGTDSSRECVNVSFVTSRGVRPQRLRTIHDALPSFLTFRYPTEPTPQVEVARIHKR